MVFFLRIVVLRRQDTRTSDPQLVFLGPSGDATRKFPHGSKVFRPGLDPLV